MSGKLQNVVVLAASGNLGPAVVKELLAAGFTITATSRPESKSTFQDGVKVVKTDYSTESLVSIFKGQDAVVSFAGATQLADQQKYVDAALAAGVKRFIPSEFGGDTRSDETAKAIPLFAVKKGVVEYLRTKESEGLSWTAVWTGPFFDWGLLASFLGFDLKTRTASIYDGGNVPVTVTNLATIGKAVAAILNKPDVTANKYVQVETATLTQLEILAALEDASGAKWTVEQLDSLVERKNSFAEVAKGNFEAFYGVLKSYILGGQEVSHADARKNDIGIWNDKLELPAEDWKDTVKALAS
jgi:uncharacterized protein YbjT (DUF2867 family)